MWSPISSVEIYDPSFTITVDRLVITSTSPLPDGAAGGFYSHQLSATGSGAITRCRVLVTGGTGSDGQRLATIEVYHPGS